MITNHFNVRPVPAILLVLFYMASPGCAQRDPLSDWIHAKDERLWRETSSTASRTQTSSTAEPILNLTTDSGPEEYVRLALQRNPEIRAAEQRIAALAQRIPQVTSLDDPMLEIAPVGEMAETAAGMVGVMTGVSQRFPLGGKLSAAGDVARAEVRAAAADFDTLRLRIAYEVRQAYWRFYQAERGREIVNESRTVLEQLAQTADAQYRAGRAAQQDVLRATVELSELDARRLTFEQESAAAQAALNQLIDRPIDSDLPHPASAEVQWESLRLEVLLAAAMENNPGLRQTVAEIEADRQRVRLSRLQRVPDLNVSLAYNFVDDEGLSPIANGDDQWWLGFGINLPIWNGRLEAAEREARLNQLARISDLAAARNTVALRVREALLAAETAHRRALLFQNEILPQARQAVDASLGGYRAGGVDFLTLASNWRSLLEFQLMLHENIAALNRAVADLNQTIGAMPAEQVQSQENRAVIPGEQITEQGDLQ